MLVKEHASRYHILRHLQREAEKNKLVGSEVVSGVILTDKEWTSENVCRKLLDRCLEDVNSIQGLLTAAQKLQRRKIWSLFEEEIDQAYKICDGNRIVSGER